MLISQIRRLTCFDSIFVALCCAVNTVLYAPCSVATNVSSGTSYVRLEHWYAAAVVLLCNSRDYMWALATPTIISICALHDCVAQMFFGIAYVTRALA